MSDDDYVERNIGGWYGLIGWLVSRHEKPREVGILLRLFVLILSQLYVVCKFVRISPSVKLFRF